MTKTIKITTLAILLAVAACGLNFTTNISRPVVQPEQTEAFIIDIIDIGLHQMSWPPMSGTGTYLVTIRNLSTNIIHSQFSTTATSSLVYGLVQGNGYRFTVVKGSSFVITEDQIVL